MRLNLEPRVRRRSRKRKGKNPGKTIWYVLGAASGYVLAKFVVGYAAYRYARSRPMTCPNCDASVVCEPLLAMPQFMRSPAKPKQTPGQP